MTDSLVQNLNEVLVELVIALLGLLAAYLMAYLRKASNRLAAETENIQNKTQASILSDAIHRIDDLAERTVAKLEQTLAGDLRKAVKNGKADRGELLQLGEHAVDEVMAMAGPEVLDILDEKLGDSVNFIKSTVEQKVLNLKAETPGKSANAIMVPLESTYPDSAATPSPVSTEVTHEQPAS